MEDEKNVGKEKPPVDDVGVKSPTGIGMKIVVTVIIVAAVFGALGAAYFFIIVPDQERETELRKHESFLAAYTTIKNTGYDEFWKCVFPLAAEEQANTNLKLESIIRNAISQNEEGFGKHILGCLETLKKHFDASKDFESLPEYEEDIKQLPHVLEAVYNTWSSLGDEFASAGQRDKWDKRLDEVASKGWGQMYVDYEKRKKSSDETIRNARRYMKFVTCAVGKTYKELGSTITEVEKALTEIVLNDLCVSPEKAIERADYIEDNCVTYLLSPEPPLPDDDWNHVAKRGLFYETRSLAVIAGSWEGQQGCLRLARMEKEKLLIQNLFNAWLAYKKVAKSVENTYVKTTKELKKK